MNENPWIRVEDRLPESDAAVLVCIDVCGALKASYGFRWNGTEWEVELEVECDYWARYEGTVTHWMPMPEPPKIDKLPEPSQPEPCDFRATWPGSGDYRCTFPKKGAEPTGFPPCRFDACEFSHPVRLPLPPPRPWLSEAYETRIKRVEPMSLEEIRDLLQNDSVQRAIADVTDAVRRLVEAMPEFRIDTNENGEPSVTAV